MPIAKIQTPDGKTMTLEVPEGATDQQIIDFAIANYKPSQPQKETSIMDKALGVGDAALTVGSGIVSDVAGGLSGLVQSVNPWAEQGAGAKTALSVKEALSYEPRTQVGKDILGTVGDVVQPVADVANKVTKGLGNFGQETATALGASPEFAGATGALLETAPTAALEYLGFKGLRASTKAAVKSAPSNVKAMVKEAAPTIEQLKTKSSQLYDQLDQSTAKIKPQIYDKIVESVSKDVGSINPKLYPKSAGAFEELKKGIGEAKTFKQLNELRQITADAAFNIMDKADARIGKIMLEKVDSAIDRLSEAVGGDAKGARELWKRAKKRTLLQIW
jgi:vacuolar-type H+-ATPase subunit H